MSVLRSSDIRSLTQASTSTSQGLNELNQIAFRQALTPKQRLFSDTEPADYLFKAADGGLKAYRLLPDGRCQVTGFSFLRNRLGVEFSGIISQRTRGEVQVLRGEALSKIRKGFSPRTRPQSRRRHQFGSNLSGNHKVLRDIKHINLHHKERLYEPLGRRQGTPGSLGKSQTGGQGLRKAAFGSQCREGE